MAKRTFGTKLAVGMGLMGFLTLLMVASAIAALTVVTNSKDAIIKRGFNDLLASEQLNTETESRIAATRSFFLNGQQEFVDDAEAHHTRFLALVAQLHQGISDPAEISLLDAVSRAELGYSAALTTVIELRRKISNKTPVEQLVAKLTATPLKPARLAMQQSVNALTASLHTDLQTSARVSSQQAQQAIIVLIVLGLLSLGCAIAVAMRLNRDLRREVGTAVGHIQSSSAQLEAAAAQQATGGREQASAMNEITTTISELLITSRQIAENAQRVSKIAEDTADAARSGDDTIEQTRDSISAIRHQVDQIVQHMLALGEKSQQIGGVVELVSELAEQTNILAINATIEASGAGEWGRRFAVVAEEIRKLADRTAGSAKEIRALIEDVRGAVNVTVMATEIGAKAVDTGARQFDAATDSFRQIASLVATTNNATREIELSTKQQTTAVEQVSGAASDTARVTRETEVSATQTRQTASHLSGLSSELLALVGTGNGRRL